MTHMTRRRSTPWGHEVTVVVAGPYLTYHVRYNDRKVGNLRSAGLWKLLPQSEVESTRLRGNFSDRHGALIAPVWTLGSPVSLTSIVEVNVSSPKMTLKMS